MPRNPTDAAGLRLHKAGMTGGQASNFGQSALFQTVAGYTNPRLVSFFYGTNETNANTLPSVMRVNIQRMVNYYRAINPNCDFIFIGPNQQSYGVETTKDYAASDYCNAMYALAVDNKGAYLDFDQIFGPFVQAQVDGGFIDSDRVHPGTRGRNVIANNLFQALLPGGYRMRATTSQLTAMRALDGLEAWNTTLALPVFFSGGWQRVSFSGM